MNSDASFEPGVILRCAPVSATRSQVIAFAQAYDPQPFHLSDEGAQGTIFGRLAASGWHTATLAIQALLNGEQSPLAGGSLAAIRDLRWRRPVYPDDTLTLTAQVIDSADAKAGQLRLDMTLRNQDDVSVLTLQAIVQLGG